MKINKVVIPVAGLATRMFPATKAVPKSMLPVYSKPTLQYVIEEVVEAGIEHIILIVNEDCSTIDKHFNLEIDDRILKSSNILKNDIEDLEKTLKCKIDFVVQKEQKGLGHAILCAKDCIGNEDFCVVLGDVIIYSNTKSCTSQLIDIYNKYQKTVVGVEEILPENRKKYGILEGKLLEDNIYNSNRLVEKPDEGETDSNLAMVGRYVVKNKILDFLENQVAGKNGEIQFTDSLNKFSVNGELLGVRFKGKTYDVGNRLGVLIANIEFGLRDISNRESIKFYLNNLVNSNFEIGDKSEI